MNLNKSRSKSKQKGIKANDVVERLELRNIELKNRKQKV